MRVLIIGASGYLGSEIRRQATRAAGLLTTRLRGAREFTAVTPPGLTT